MVLNEIKADEELRYEFQYEIIQSMSTIINVINRSISSNNDKNPIRQGIIRIRNWMNN